MGNKITDIYPLENIENSVHHFAIGAQDFNDTLKKIREKGEEFNGVFHSHPTTAPYPSLDDVNNAYNKKIIYFIVSFTNQAPQLAAYRIDDAGVISKLEVRKIQ